RGSRKGAQHYERGLAIDALLLAPADAWAWVILGNLNFRQNFALAERYFRRAVELSPTDAYAWNGIGVMYSEKHDYPKAIAAFESALKKIRNRARPPWTGNRVGGLGRTPTRIRRARTNVLVERRAG